MIVPAKFTCIPPDIDDVIEAGCGDCSREISINYLKYLEYKRQALFYLEFGKQDVMIGFA